LRAEKSPGQAATRHFIKEQARLGGLRRRAKAVQVENQAAHSTQPKCAVSSTMTPKAMRYHANHVKSWFDT